MLRWGSFSGWGREHDAIIFELDGSQYLVYKWLQPSATEVTQDAQPKIFDAPLKLIFRMGQQPYSALFCKAMLAVCWLRIAPTAPPVNHPT